MKEFLKSLAWIDYFYMVFTDPRKLSAALIREPRTLTLDFAVPTVVFIIHNLPVCVLAPPTACSSTMITYGLLQRYILTHILPP